MPRDSSGNYTLPAGNPVVTGSVIASSWANTTMSDLATEMTDSLDRSGKGGMLAAFKVIDGTVSAPGMAFQSETGTGMYRIGAAQLGFAVTGNNELIVTTTTITAAHALTVTGLFTASANAVVSGTLTVSTSGSSIVGGLTLGAPAAGTTLTVTGITGSNNLVINGNQGATSAFAEVVINRTAGSTANAVAEGPSIGLFDTNATTETNIQHSGGQTEIWQYNGTWVQSFRILINKQVQVLDDGGTMQTIGWRGTPVNLQGVNYTLALSDRGKTVQASASINITVPQSIFSAGDVVSLAVGSGATVTVVQGSGMSMQWAGNGSTTGNRTLTGAGLAAVFFSNATNSIISGAGLT